MTKINALKTAALLVGIAVSSPIWFFLLYRILTAISADDLTWFLYWVYLPAHILVSVLVKLVTHSE